MIMDSLKQHFLMRFFLSALFFHSTLTGSFYSNAESIDIFAGDNFYMEINGIHNGTCTYQTLDKGKYYCTFQVNRTQNTFHDKEESEDRCYDRVKTNTQYCLIRLENYTKADPRQWILTPSENKSLERQVSLVLYYKTHLFYNPVRVIESGSFIQYLDVADNLRLTRCMGQYGDVNFELDLNSSSPARSDTDNDFVKRTKSLGGGKCGFQLINAKMSDSDVLITLVVQDEESIMYKASFKATVFPNRSEVTTLEVHVGDSISIPCEKDNCKLYDPLGVEIEPTGSKCTNFIRTVMNSHLGKWRCTYFASYSVNSLETTINLVPIDDLGIKTWYKDVGNSVHIGCYVENYQKSKLDYCMMTPPKGETIIVNPKIATERYTAFTTNLQNNTCGLEILKPLQDNELGSWVCQLDKEIGSFVKVGDNNNLTYLYPKRIIKIVQSGENMVVSCKVPYSSYHCQISSPTGDIYKNNRKYGSWMGQCAVTIRNVSMQHNGTWTCNYARDNGIPDEEIFVEVKVAEVLLSYERKQVTRGDAVELICKTGLPIQYCRFITPNGLSYHLKAKTNTTIDYAGRGLSYGDCGVRIKQVTEKHSGTWTCITRIGYNYANKEIKADIFLQVNEVPFFKQGINVAATVGGGIGVLLVLCGGAFIYYKRKKQSVHNGQGFQQISSRSSETSENSDPVEQAGPSFISYVNPESENVIFQVRQRNSVDLNKT